MNSDNKNKTQVLHILQKAKTALTAADFPVKSFLRAVAMACLSAVTSGASLFGIAHPFGIALTAAATSGITAAAAAIGTVIGSLATPDFLGLSVASCLLFLARIGVGAFLASGRDKLPPPEEKDDLSVPLSPRVGFFASCLRYADLSGAGALRGALAATAAMAAGAISLALSDTYSVPALLSVFFSAIVTPLCAVTFAAVLDQRRTALRQAGELLLLFAAARSLHEATVLPFDAGIVFAFAAPLILAFRGAKTSAMPISAAAVTAGLIAGVALDASAAPVYAAAAVAAGLIMKLSSPAAVCAGWLAAVAVSFAGGGLAALSTVMPEITVTAAILVPLFRFSLIPAPTVRASTAIAEGAAAETAAIEGARADDAVKRVEQIAGSFADLSKVCSAVSERLCRPGVIELKEICDKATGAHCAQCDNRVLCWEREYATTADTVCRITAALHKDGRVSAAVIPPSLAARCHHMDSILTEVNERCADCAAAAARTDKTDVLSDDFAGFSEILTATADSVREDFARDEALSHSLTRSLTRMDMDARSVNVYGSRRRHIVASALDLTRMRMTNEDIRTTFERLTGGKLTVPEYEIQGNTVTMTMESRAAVTAHYGAATRAAGEGENPQKKVLNGDVAAQFQTEDGRYIAIITDGMGTGGEAAVTARMAVTFLTKMLSARLPLRGALTMLNNYLRARNLECSAGIDVMEIDLYQAEARFVKSGAAPSFVVRQGRLFRLASKTVPIGILRALDAEMIRFTIEPGDTVVMLSDGVMAGFEEAAWLCDLLASPAVMAGTPAEIAQRIVTAAATESRDDITAAVIRIGNA